MAKGNQFSSQAACYDDLEGENSNAGETPMKGNQWADGPKYGGGGSSGSSSSTSVGIDAAKAQRGGE